MTATAIDRPRPAGALRAIADDIKIAHSVFALPFAVLAAFLAADGTDGIAWSRFGGQLALVVAAMVAARTFAMLANRILDRRIDARNPRTAARALPSGRLSLRTALAALAASALAFAAICALFLVLHGNPWPIALAVPVLAWIGAYGLFKRFTWACHLWLGASLGLSPLAAALAVDPAALRDQPALWALAAMVVGWVAGFDVIYALQDVEADRRDGLHSLPSRLGPRRALRISAALHLLSGAALVAAWRLDPRLGAPFAVGVALALVLLAIEHATVARWGTTRIALTFFTINGAISCVLGGLGVLDVVLPA